MVHEQTMFTCLSLGLGYPFVCVCVCVLTGVLSLDSYIL